MRYRVVACIPSKDCAWILQKTLKHLSSFCHKIIISDDQSTDNTEDICHNYQKVEYYKRPARNPKDRQGSIQRQELLDRAYAHNPDYFFFLDADELPSPDIVEWINQLKPRTEEENNLWTFPWIHLWQDENHYRVDSYTAKNGANMSWNPFVGSYRKGFLVRNKPNYKLAYDTTQHRVRPSNQPANTPKPWIDVQQTPVILHYGKISEYFKSGQNFKDRAGWDQFQKGASYNETLQHHQIANSEETLKLEHVKPEWLWK